MKFPLLFSFFFKKASLCRFKRFSADFTVIFYEGYGDPVYPPTFFYAALAIPLAKENFERTRRKKGIRKRGSTSRPAFVREFE